MVHSNSSTEYSESQRKCLKLFKITVKYIHMMYRDVVRVSLTRWQCSVVWDTNLLGIFLAYLMIM